MLPIAVQSSSVIQTYKAIPRFKKQYSSTEFCRPYYTGFQKNRIPETFYYNFAKIVVISINIGITYTMCI